MYISEVSAVKGVLRIVAAIVVLPLAAFAAGTSANVPEPSAQVAAVTSTNVTLAVFGGSFSVMKESRTAKQAWCEALPATYDDYGRGGCGFFRGEDIGYDVPSQVRRALDSGKKYDCFVLWASTNDIWSRDIERQNAGIRKAVGLIRERAPKSKIAFFTSMPIPLKGEKTNALLGEFVDAQLAVCRELGMPVLDLYRQSGIDAANGKAYVASDGLHPSIAGYAKVAPLQIKFLHEVLGGTQRK